MINAYQKSYVVMEMHKSIKYSVTGQISKTNGKKR